MLLGRVIFDCPHGISDEDILGMEYTITYEWYGNMLVPTKSVCNKATLNGKSIKFKNDKIGQIK